jgi:alginate O-acetyltransferase complex protein AlgI
MAVVFVGWIFFRAPLFSDAVTVLARILTPGAGWAQTKLAPVFFELLLLYLPLQWLVHRTTWGADTLVPRPAWQVPAFSLLSAFALVYYVDGNQFIYFQF